MGVISLSIPSLTKIDSTAISPGEPYPLVRLTILEPIAAATGGFSPSFSDLKSMLCKLVLLGCSLSATFTRLCPATLLSPFLFSLRSLFL
jgi:hypothetical protein